jgi:hypothetical protein
MRIPPLIKGALIGFFCWWLTTPCYSVSHFGVAAAVFWMTIGLGIGLYLDLKENRPGPLHAPSANDGGVDGNPYKPSDEQDDPKRLLFLIDILLGIAWTLVVVFAFIWFTFRIR